MATTRQTHLGPLPRTLAARPRRRLRGVWLTALSGAALLGACAQGPTDRGGDGSAPALDRVRAVVLPFLTMAPFHIAAEEGYFAEQGLEVEFVRLTRNVDAIAALATGDVDVGAGQLTLNIVNTIARGARIRLVAGAGHFAPDACTFNALVTRRDLVESGVLDTATGLRDQTYEYEIVLPQGYWMSKVLAPVGLTLDDITGENIPPTATHGALVSGAIDVAFLSEPYLSELTSSGDGVIWRSAQEIVPDFQISSVLFGPNMLDDRPEVGERFITAFVQGMRRYNEGRTPRNLEILERGTGLRPEQLAKACLPVMSEDGRIRAEPFHGYQEWALSRELISRIVPDDELIDSRFVEYANAELAR